MSTVNGIPDGASDDQEYVYKTLEVGSGGMLSSKTDDPEPQINKMADLGFRLVDTISEDNGRTQFLVFEKKRSD